MTKHWLLAIDQGTTSSRAMIFDLDGRIIVSSQREFEQFFPKDGWVEHDPEQIWSSTLSVCREVLEYPGAPENVAAAGISNQRETTLVWDRRTGQAIYPAIVWQDRRTADYCQRLKFEYGEAQIQSKTGLLLDPYFSASKIAWILENVPGARTDAENGKLAFGTVDSFLIWRLTQGKVHATDATNASRTLLFNIHTQHWDDDLLALFRIPRALLPEVQDCAADFGSTASGVLAKAIPIRGVAGDQQAATIGQACLKPGQAKCTFGTGGFVMLNTGGTPLASRNKLLSTTAYRIAGKPTYALEGSIFIAGAAIKWLRDTLGILSCAQESETLAKTLDNNGNLYLVPAFTGLGAPHWDAHARGAIFGITRDTGPAHFARAALEAAAYQTHDLLQAFMQDGQAVSHLRVDGGMSANNWFLQFLADLLDLVVERPRVIETTALGASGLAAVGVGLVDDLAGWSAAWHSDSTFEPRMQLKQRELLLAGWRRAVAGVLGNRV